MKKPPASVQLDTGAKNNSNEVILYGSKPERQVRGGGLMPRVANTGWAMAPYPLMDQVAGPGGKQRLIVYLFLHRHGYGSDRGCYASVTTLAEETGIARRDVIESLRWLVEEGWVSREQRPGMPSVYQVWADAPNRRTSAQKDTTPTSDQKGTGVVTKRAPGVVPKRAHKQEPSNKNPEQEPPVSPSGTKRTKFLIQPSDLPENLAPVAERLCYWWAKAKAGEKSPRSLKLLLASLEKIRAEGGIEAVSQQIETAIAAKEEVGRGWQSIAYSNWIRFRPRSEALKAQEQALVAKPSQEQEEALELAQSRPDLFMRAWISNRGMAHVQFTDEAHAAASALKGESYPRASATGTVEALRFEIAFLERAMEQATSDQGLDSFVCPF